MLTKHRKDFLQFFIGVVFTKIFDVDIGELHSFGAKLHLSFLTGLKVANKTADRIEPITTKDNKDMRTLAENLIVRIVEICLWLQQTASKNTRQLMRTSTNTTVRHKSKNIFQ